MGIENIDALKPNDDLPVMHWKDAVDLAKKQPDVTYEEWCNLYVPSRNPTPQHLDKATKAARSILVRNKLMEEDGAFNVFTPVKVRRRSVAAHHQR